MKADLKRQFFSLSRKIFYRKSSPADISVFLHFLAEINKTFPFSRKQSKCFFPQKCFGSILQCSPPLKEGTLYFGLLTTSYSKTTIQQTNLLEKYTCFYLHISYYKKNVNVELLSVNLNLLSTADIAEMIY